MYTSFAWTIKPKMDVGDIHLCLGLLECEFEGF